MAATRRRARPRVRVESVSRYQVRGPHPGLTSGYARWSVVDTEDRGITVDTVRTKKEAREVARELNAEERDE